MPPASRTTFWVNARLLMNARQTGAPRTANETAANMIALIAVATNARHR